MKTTNRNEIAYYAGRIIFEVILGVALAVATGGGSVAIQGSTKLNQLANIALRELIATITLGFSEIIIFCKSFFSALAKAIAKGMVYFIDDMIRFFKIIVNGFQNVLEEVNVIMKSAKTLAEESSALFLKLFKKRANQIKNLEKLGLRLENKIDANGIVQVFFKEINIFEEKKK